MNDLSENLHLIIELIGQRTGRLNPNHPTNGDNYHTELITQRFYSFEEQFLDDINMKLRYMSTYDRVKITRTECGKI